MDIRLKPFEGYLGKIVLHDNRLYFVKDVCIERNAVSFLLRSEEGEERKISTTTLLGSLLEEMEPRVYEFLNPSPAPDADRRQVIRN